LCDRQVPAADTPEWQAAKDYWRALATDPGAKFDKEVYIDGADIAPTVTWGTSPEHVAPVTGVVPDPNDEADPAALAGGRGPLPVFFEGTTARPLPPWARLEGVRRACAP
jgi:homoaconitase/3-isopropylmalate dehydratase large subunit